MASLLYFLFLLFIFCKSGDNISYTNFEIIYSIRQCAVTNTDVDHLQIKNKKSKIKIFILCRLVIGAPKGDNKYLNGGNKKDKQSGTVFKCSATNPIFACEDQVAFDESSRLYTISI